MGVWIETGHPEAEGAETAVTPCMGVWIETLSIRYIFSCQSVTPCMGVWIETTNALRHSHIIASHPVWVCGLKHQYALRNE